MVTVTTSFIALIHRRTMEITEILLAVCLLTIGYYVGSPAFHDLVPSMAELLTAGGFRWPMFAIYMVTPLLSIIGVTINNLLLRSVGTFSLFSVYLFLTLFRWAEYGPLSVLWVLTAICAILALLCYINIRLGPWNRH